MLSLFLISKASKHRHKHIKNHKYNCQDNSILLNKFLKPYVLKNLIKYIPKYIAPNIITLCGFVIMLLNLAMVFKFDITLTGSRIVSISSAICMSLSYILDSLDGIQARKTQNGSPLGQIFDHTVDSISVNCIFLFLVSTLGYGISKTSLIIIYVSQICFMVSTMEEKYTGLFYFGPISAATEGHFLLVFFHAFLSLLGPEYIKKFFDIPNIKFYFTILLFISASIYIAFSMYTIGSHIKITCFYELFYPIIMSTSIFYMFHRNLIGYYQAFFIGTLFFSNFMLKLLDSIISKTIVMPMFSCYLNLLIVFLFEIGASKNKAFTEYSIKLFVIILILEYIIDIIVLVRFYERILNISWYKVKKSPSDNLKA